MKKQAIIVLLIWCLFVGIFWPYRVKAYADPFTASQIGAVAYAMFNSWGITFSAGNATAIGMNEWMTGTVENYASSQGKTVTEAFLGQIAVDTAGKLVVGQLMYNSMVNFLDWVKNAYDLSSVDFSLSDGEYNGQFLPTTETKTEEITGVGIEVVTDSESYVPQYNYYRTLICYNGGLQVASMYSSGVYGFSGNYYVNLEGSRVVVYYEQIDRQGEHYRYLSKNVATIENELDNTLTWNGTDFVQPTVLNPDKEWTGYIDGYSQPDTNLDQLMGNIYDAVADNNLDVDGEVIDVPVPPGPIPTWTPVDDVIDGINGLGEELDGIGQDIGDISGHLDDIGDQIDDMTGALEGVQEGIHTQTGVISGALDQAAQDVVDAIGEQTSTLDQTLTETAEGVQDIAETLQPGEIEPKKFDLRRLFPFCIPFDIHNLLQKFNATPVAPHVQLPFVIQSLGFSYTFDLDFSAFDPVAQAMRTVEFIVFAIGLAWATSKVIKW